MSRWELDITCPRCAYRGKSAPVEFDDPPPGSVTLTASEVAKAREALEACRHADLKDCDRNCLEQCEEVRGAIAILDAALRAIAAPHSQPPPSDEANELARHWFGIAERSRQHAANVLALATGETHEPQRGAPMPIIPATDPVAPPPPARDKERIVVLEKALREAERWLVEAPTIEDGDESADHLLEVVRAALAEQPKNLEQGGQEPPPANVLRCESCGIVCGTQASPGAAFWCARCRVVQPQVTPSSASAGVTRAPADAADAVAAERKLRELKSSAVWRRAEAAEAKVGRLKHEIATTLLADGISNKRRAPCPPRPLRRSRRAGEGAAVMGVTSEQLEALAKSDSRFFVRYDPLGECREVIDRTTGEPIGSDGGEPEDQVLVRDWWWVVEALNRVDAERQATEAAVAAARAEERVALVKAICPACAEGVPVVGDSHADEPCVAANVRAAIRARGEQKEGA